MVAFYRLNTEYNTAFVLSAGVFGMISAAFYGWLPLYLPELFRTAVRATGQGFGFNFGRIIAAAGNLQMANLLGGVRQATPPRRAPSWPGVYVVGSDADRDRPETEGPAAAGVRSRRMTAQNSLKGPAEFILASISDRCGRRREVAAHRGSRMPCSCERPTGRILFTSAGPGQPA